MKTKKEEDKKNPEAKKMFGFKFLILIVGIVLSTVVISGLVIDSIEFKMNQRVYETCKDPMIKYRSCEDLLYASSHCEEAQMQYFENNCKVTTLEDIQWEIKEQ